MMVVMGEGEQQSPARMIVALCPTVEELRQKDSVACPSENTHPYPGRNKLVCPVPGCGVSNFKRERGVIQHINSMHPHLNPYRRAPGSEKNEEYHFHCPQEDCIYNVLQQQRWFSSLSLLRYHYVNTHDEKRFACAKCGRRFGWKRDQQTHERECGQTFACDVCPATYVSRNSLQSHCSRHKHPMPAQFARQQVQKASSRGMSVMKLEDPQSSTGQPSVPSAVTVSPAVTVCPASVTQCVTLKTSGASPVLSSTSSGASDVTSSVIFSSSADPPGISAVTFSASPDSSGLFPPAVLSPTSASSSFRSAIRLLSVSSSDCPAARSSTVSCVSQSATPAGCSEASLTSGTAPDVFILSATCVSQVPSGEILSSPASVPVVSQGQTGLSPSLINPPLPALSALDVSQGEVVSESDIHVSLSAVCSSGVMIAISPQSEQSSSSDTTTMYSRTGNIVQDIYTAAHTEPNNSSVCSDTTKQTVVTKHNSDIIASGATAAYTTATHSQGPRKKLRPILPKSQGLVVLGTGRATLYTHTPEDSEMVLNCSSMPWMDTCSSEAAGVTVDGKTQGVSASCQTGMGAEGHGESGAGVHVSVVHMATQASAGAPHPTCHTGTQVYGLRCGADSTHTGVQTCALTTHSATQLAAPLPAETVDSLEGDRILVDITGQLEERPHVSAVAIQTGSQVEMVSMAIQATGQHLAAHSSGVMVDMIRLCDGDSKNDHYTTGGLSGTHTASQTSFPYILLNKANSTSTTGTQVATGCILEEMDVVSKGMQTLVTLIQRSKLSMTAAAQTQTILPCDEAGSHQTSVSTSLRSLSRASGSGRGRKRSMRCREVQTSQPSSPRCKKGRRKKRACSTAHSLQEISIATQTLAEQPLPTHSASDTISSQINMGWAYEITKQQKKDKNVKGKSSRSKGTDWKSAASSPHIQQNPPPSVSASQPVEWDPFLSPPIGGGPSSPATPPCGLPPQLEDLLSEYRVDLGVQTTEHFLSPFTADIGMQTMMDDVLSTTADLAVQTLDVERCTADFGVQTTTTVLGCLLENLDSDLVCSDLGEGIMDSAATSSLSCFQPQMETTSQQLVLGSESQNSKSTIASLPQTFSSQSEVFDLHMDTSLNTGATPKLFDSFDSDLSFSDCGTGTEDFFASTHTQTANVELTMGEGCLQPMPSMSSVCGGEPGMKGSELHEHTLQNTEEKERTLREGSIGRYSVDRSINRTGMREMSVDRSRGMRERSVDRSRGMRERSVDRSIDCADVRERNVGRSSVDRSRVNRSIDCAGVRDRSVDRSSVYRGIDKRERSIDRTTDRREMSVDRTLGMRERSFDRNIGMRERSLERNIGMRERSLDRRARSVDRTLDRRERRVDRSINMREKSIDRSIVIRERSVDRSISRERSIDRSLDGRERSIDRTINSRERSETRSIDSASRTSLELFTTAVTPPTHEANSLSGEADLMLDFCHSPSSPCLGRLSRPTSTSTTDTDLLSGVTAMDMHTQTADHDALLTLLMNNMETQTQEELFHSNLGVADSHTQTTTIPADVLLTPPHPLSSCLVENPTSVWEQEAEGMVVSAETQTSGQFYWDLQDPDQQEWFDLADMETQTMFL